MCYNILLYSKYRNFFYLIMQSDNSYFSYNNIIPGIEYFELESIFNFPFYSINCDNDEQSNFLYSNPTESKTPRKKQINLNLNNNIKNNSTPDRISTKIFSITKTPKLLRGRKRKNPNNQKNNNYKIHDKYSEDNIFKRIKTRLFSSIIKFINSKFNKIDKKVKKSTKCEYNSYEKILVKPDQSIISATGASYSIKLLNKTLREIFTGNTSVKYKNHPNKKIIQKIYSENKDTEVISILNMTLFQCLEHLRRSHSYDELLGLEKEYDIIIYELKASGESKDYIDIFLDKMKNYENILKLKGKKGKNREE